MAPRRLRWKSLRRTTSGGGFSPQIRTTEYPREREKEQETRDTSESSDDETVCRKLTYSGAGLRDESNPLQLLLLALVLLLASNFAGHYYPILWSREMRQDLLQNWASVSKVWDEIGRKGDDVREMLSREIAAQYGNLSWGPSSALKAEQQGVVRAEEEWRTRYIRPLDINIGAEPLCSGIVPPEFYSSNTVEPITVVADLLRPNQRVLVFLPRHGLGNSLRGFVSAYVYALLSGRRLVRFHAAEHAKVYDLLCEAFECGFDSIHWHNETGERPMEVYHKFSMLQPMYFLEIYRSIATIAETLKSDYPIMATRSGSHFDLFWHRNARIRSCVYAAFACDSLWCVHSRAMFALIGKGGPTDALEEVLSHVFRRNVPESEEQLRSDVARGKFAEFDVALHVRTRTLAVEKAVKKDTEQYAATECLDKDEVEANRPKFLRECLWECIGVILGTLKSSVKKERGIEGLSIFLATDDELLRPVFVQKLQKYGTVFYSSGKVLHTSKTGGASNERLPTMAEYYLMAKANTLIEAGSYISTFAYFASLLGNGTLSGINMKNGGCRLRYEHKAEVV